MRRPFRIGQRERDLDDELAFHLAERERALVAAGAHPTEARARALEQFGDLSGVRAACLTIDKGRERAVRWSAMARSVAQDVTYALRTLRRQPGFAAIVLLILAVGIGANTAIFTLVDALLLRPLPVPHPEQLVAVGNPRRTGGTSLGTPSTELASYPLYVDLRDHARTLTGLYASGRSDRLDVLLGRGGQATHPRGRFVSGNFFTVLGISVVAGRTFAADEDRAAGAGPVVVLSYGYWQRTLAADPSAVGRTLLVDGVPLTIIGIAPPAFTGDAVGQATDLWLPITMAPLLVPQRPWLTDRGLGWLLMMGRLAPGATLPMARSELMTLAARSMIGHATAADHAMIEHLVHAKPVLIGSGAAGFSYYRAVYAAALVTLMAAVGLVLLVGCANIANLLLARAVARAREMSVRIAIGANRWRLVQQLLTESLVLAVAGAILGVVVAVAGSTALLRLVHGVTLSVGLDGRVLAFAAGVSIATAILFGLVPALRGTRLPVAAALRTQGGGAGSPAMALGRYLVVAQVALSMLLVVGAGMLARSTWQLAHADVGVARDDLVIVDIDAQRDGYAGGRLPALMRDLTARLQRVPGVAAVTLSENGIFSGTESGTTVQIEGFVARADSDTLVAEDVVGPSYFRAVGAHILRGRDIETRDNETGAKVAVVNASFARFFFPGGDAIGHHVLADSVVWEIVGIIADIHEAGVRDQPQRRLYASIYQTTPVPGHFRLEVRASGDPARLVIPLRQALLAADPSLTVLGVDPLADLIRDSISGDRLVATLVSVFGVLALVLAALGLYGVMAYTTTRRIPEFGLRMALGAKPATVGRMVLREATAMTGVGIAIGLPVALISARLLRRVFFGVAFFDPPSIGLAVLVLGLSGAAAACLPAIRAMRVAPVDAIHDT